MIVSARDSANVWQLISASIFATSTKPPMKQFRQYVCRSNNDPNNDFNSLDSAFHFISISERKCCTLWLSVGMCFSKKLENEWFRCRLLKHFTMSMQYSWMTHGSNFAFRWLVEIQLSSTKRCYKKQNSPMTNSHKFSTCWIASETDLDEYRVGLFTECYHTYLVLSAQCELVWTQWTLYESRATMMSCWLSALSLVMHFVFFASRN